MRKLFFPLVAIALLFVMASCTKCKTCDVTITTTATGMDPVVSKTSQEYCDDQLKEVDGKTIESTSGGAKVSAVYDCKK